MAARSDSLARTQAFCDAFDLEVPILMAPMAGACPPELAIAVGKAGGMGACGCLLMRPEQIEDWVGKVRAGSNGAFQLNLWIPDPAPVRDPVNEAAVRDFLREWGPEVAADAGDVALQDFDAQMAAILAAGPAVISSIMGVYPPDFVAEMKARGIKWMATVTTVGEAEVAVGAGADAVVAQGMEAGGHRGAFEADEAQARMIGLFSLLPQVVDAVDVPVIAAGGIGDGRQVAAALMLGASAVQVGTGLLRSPEAAIAPAWADAIGQARPEDTIGTRAFSGRLGRSIRTGYAAAASDRDAPAPAPYPVQRGLTQAMRDQGARDNDIDRLQAWAGQSAGFAEERGAGEIVTRLWHEARVLLG